MWCDRSAHNGFDKMVKGVIGICIIDAVGGCGGHDDGVSDGSTVIVVVPLVVQVIVVVLWCLYC